MKRHVFISSIVLLTATISQAFGTNRVVSGTSQIYARQPRSVSATKYEDYHVRNDLTIFDQAIAGAVAQMVGATAFHPMDTVKTLQQSSDGEGLSITGAAKKILEDKGIRGLYAGFFTFLVADGLAGAIKFAIYEYLKRTSEKVPSRHHSKILFLCAAIAFIACSVVLVPGELLKQRIQTGQASSLSQGLVKILQNKGFRGLYLGYFAVCLRDIPFTALELGIYENLKSLCLRVKNSNTVAKRQESNELDEMIAAAITGGAAGYLTTPLDTIKTKLMTARDTQYEGFADCLRKTAAENGLSSLFRGSMARVAWVMPFTALYLPIYELLKRKIARMKASGLRKVERAHWVVSKTGRPTRTVHYLSHQGSIPGDVASATETGSIEMRNAQFFHFICQCPYNHTAYKNRVMPRHMCVTRRSLRSGPKTERKTMITTNVNRSKGIDRKGQHVKCRNCSGMLNR